MRPYYGWALKNRAASCHREQSSARRRGGTLRARHLGRIVIDAVVPGRLLRALSQALHGGWGRRFRST